MTLLYLRLLGMNSWWKMLLVVQSFLWRLGTSLSCTWEGLLCWDLQTAFSCITITCRNHSWETVLKLLTANPWTIYAIRRWKGSHRILNLGLGLNSCGLSQTASNIIFNSNNFIDLRYWCFKKFFSFFLINRLRLFVFIKFVTSYSNIRLGL